MFRLYLDPGHGGNDSGAVGNGLQEKHLTLDIALRIKDILNSDFEDVSIKMSRNTDITVPLEQRTKEANEWNANYYLSIHVNAFNGTARGYEDYIHDSISNDHKTAQYQSILHEEVTKVNRLFNRGKKKANFHVLRETLMPALLTENGFIDNANDAEKLSDPNWRHEIAQGHVNGLVKAFNFKRKNSIFYKVIAGSFLNLENAQQRKNFVEEIGYEAHISKEIIENNEYYRVQVGVFSQEVNAIKLRDTVRGEGVSDAYIITTRAVTNKDSSVGNEASTENNNELNQEPIMGHSVLSDIQLNNFVVSVNAKAPSLGKLYIDIGKKYGVQGDVAFAQALHETNYFRYGGQVQQTQNNYAGIGATNDGSEGTSFSTPKDGVTAHIQHLYAYASTKPLPYNYELVDPRFELVTRGSAPTWKDLNGRWAVPGHNYGQSIMGIYNNMFEFTNTSHKKATDDVLSSIQANFTKIIELMNVIEKDIKKLV